ncbi:hypothetical protein ACTXKF_19660, partial [Vreelandella alkaliphila]
RAGSSHWRILLMSCSSTEVARDEVSRIRELSADEETRRLAFVRKRALRDEVSLLNDQIARQTSAF